jgi:tol-pal system protein YbgF
MRKLILLGVCFLSFSEFAQAAIFDDKEARQQIIDLQIKTDTQNQSTLSAITALEKRIIALENIVKSQALMDLFNQVEQLNKELRTLKGQLEVAQRGIDVSQQRQKDLYSDTDSRLRKLETAPPPVQVVAQPTTQLIGQQASQAVPVPAPEPVKVEVSEEVRSLEAAQQLFKESKFKLAFEAYNKFLKDYPNSQSAADAFFGLGSTQFSLKYYKAALATLQKLIAQFPESEKIPEAKFSLANCQIQLAQIDAAKKTLRELIEQFPDHEVIPNAKRRLAVLDSIKK